MDAEGFQKSKTSSEQPFNWAAFFVAGGASSLLPEFRALSGAERGIKLLLGPPPLAFGLWTGGLLEYGSTRSPAAISMIRGN